MDFALSEEQELFRATVRSYLDDVGQTKIARNLIDGDIDGVKKVLKEFAELGCTSINIPEEYGGLELESLDLVPIFEEIGRSLLPGTYLETMALAVPLLKKYGTKEQKEKYLPDIADGSRNIVLGWAEPNSGYEPNKIECFAREVGNSLIIDGVKSLVPDGAIADTILLLVRTSNSNEGNDFSLVFVDRTEDIQTRRQKCIDETKELTEFHFHQVEVSKEQMLGTKGQGWSILQDGLLYLNAALSSVMVGGMDRIVNMASEYAKIREQFGQPIGRFQAVKHKIVDMKVELEIARSLSYYANWVLDREEEDREAAIYSARSFATNAFIGVASQNIQVHGGIGYTEEIDCHLYVKRARYYEHYLGLTSHYKEQIASALGW